jgi:orotidine-5'-phosphate decarboxylase
MHLQDNFGKRLTRVFETSGHLCVGVDPHSTLLTEWGLADSVDGLLSFSMSVIEACTGNVGVIKPQVSFYERFGSKGFGVLERLTQEAHSAGLLVIADAKRGDIGTTMSAYFDAWFGDESGLYADALTVSPYLGLGAFAEGMNHWAAEGKGIFSLVATSNPEGQTVQNAKVGDMSLAADQFTQLDKLNGSQFGPYGAVVGGTLNLTKFGLTQAKSSVPILAPGFGHQGARLSDAKEIFGAKADQVLYSVSRSVLKLGKDGVRGGVIKASNELIEALG